MNTIFNMLENVIMINMNKEMVEIPHRYSIKTHLICINKKTTYISMRTIFNILENAIKVNMNKEMVKIPHRYSLWRMYHPHTRPSSLMICISLKLVKQKTSARQIGKDVHRTSEV